MKPGFNMYLDLGDRCNNKLNKDTNKRDYIYIYITRGIMVIVEEMSMVTPVQILNNIVYIFRRANTLGKCMNQTILTTGMGW